VEINKKLLSKFDLAAMWTQVTMLVLLHLNGAAGQVQNLQNSCADGACPSFVQLKNDIQHAKKKTRELKEVHDDENAPSPAKSDWSWVHEPFADFTLEDIPCSKAEEGISKSCWDSEFSKLAGADQKISPSSLHSLQDEQRNPKNLTRADLRTGLALLVQLYPGEASRIMSVYNMILTSAFRNEFPPDDLPEPTDPLSNITIPKAGGDMMQVAFVEERRQLMGGRQLMRGNASAVIELYGMACVNAIVQVAIACLNIGFSILSIELPAGDMIADGIKANHVVVESIINYVRFWDDLSDPAAIAYDVQGVLRTLWDQNIFTTAINEAVKQYEWWRWAIMASQILGTVASWFATGGANLALSIVMLVLDAWDLTDGIISASKECNLAVGGAGNLRNAKSGKCLDSWGNHVQQWGCHGGHNQKWKFDGNHIKNEQATGKCLDLMWGGTGDGTQVQLWPCHTANGQKWKLEGDLIKNPPSGKCLEVQSASMDNGASIGLWPCPNKDHMKWKLRAPPNIGQSWSQTSNESAGKLF